MTPVGCILIVLFCLVAHAFFAGAEMGLISCNKIKMRHLANKGSRRAKTALFFLENPEKLLAATLVGVNIAVISGSSVAAYLAHSYFHGNLVPLYSTIVMWPLVLLFGEIIPKTVFLHYADRLSLAISYPLKWAYFLLFPLVAFAGAVAFRISRALLLVMASVVL